MSEWFYTRSLAEYVTAQANGSVTCLNLDSYEELLWVGFQSGRIASYLHERQLEKYTSFLISPQEVRQIISLNSTVATLSSDCIQVSTRQGVPKCTICSDLFYNMLCMVQSQQNQPLVIAGGEQTNLLAVDLGRGQVVKEYPFDKGVGLLKRSSKFLCCAGMLNGFAYLLDPLSLKTVHVLDAHTGPICDMDICGNYLATCGYGSRYAASGELFLDPYVKVYDFRTMRLLELVQFPFGPFQCKFLPKFTNRMAIVSQSGHLQITDIGTGNVKTPEYYQVETSGEFVSCMDLSTSSECMFFGDTGGLVQEWNCVADVSQAKLNSYSRPCIFPDAIANHPILPFGDSSAASLAIVPMPFSQKDSYETKLLPNFDISSLFYDPSNSKGPLLSEGMGNAGQNNPALLLTCYDSTVALRSGDETLLSTWPLAKCQIIRHPPVPIEANLLKSMKREGFYGVAPNPGVKLRNQFPYSLRALQRLQQASGGSRQTKNIAKSGITSPPARKRSGYTKSEVPKHYRQVEIKYSKIGLENFDFGLYNKTIFGGLETHIPNAYCNASLQVFYFLPCFRSGVLNHICSKEFCLTCELGFLFWMLHIAKGKNCQASNFLHALRTIPQASALGLVLKDDLTFAAKSNFPSVIQSFNRFLLQQVHQEIGDLGGDVGSMKSHPNRRRTKTEKLKETKESTPEEGSKVLQSTIVQQLFASVILVISKCQCQRETLRITAPLILDLFYPSPPFNTAKLMEHSFASVLKDSICREQTTKAWCERCQKFQTTSQSKSLGYAPNILAINCCLEKDSDFEFWQLKNEESQLKRHGSIYHIRERFPFFSEGASEPAEMARETSKDESKQGFPLIDVDNASSWIPNRLEISFDEELCFESSFKLSATENLNMEEFSKFSKKTNFLVKEFFDFVDGEGRSKSLPGTVNLPSKAVCYTYDLTSSISYIQDHKTGGNLISCVKVDSCYFNTDVETPFDQPGEQWYIFNDFSVTPITRNDAMYFNAKWKVPCSLFFVKRTDSNHPDVVATVSNLPENVLFAENPLQRDSKKMKNTLPLDSNYFVPFSRDEVPNKGDIFAIDAEFVALEQEEAHIRCDGTRATIKPSQMSLARVSVLRGQGPLEGYACIDDYIATTEHIVDYLTEYSGISPGDLDPNVSTKNLTTLKAAYLKLRWLVDRGCTFVGHGLKKDFRTINLLVPVRQVIDTVELFYLEKQRRISLKFLAWYILGIDIQTGNHDSVEDSKTALMLYKKYKEFEQEHCVDAKIREIYDAGRKCNWRAPHWSQHSQV